MSFDMNKLMQQAAQMQEQVQSQTRNMFAGFNYPGFPGATGTPGAAPAGDKDKKP